MKLVSQSSQQYIVLWGVLLILRLVFPQMPYTNGKPSARSNIWAVAAIENGPNAIINIKKCSWCMVYIAPSPHSTARLNEILASAESVGLIFLNKNLTRLLATSGAGTLSWNSKTDEWRCRPAQIYSFRFPMQQKKSTIPVMTEYRHLTKWSCNCGWRW